MPPISTAPMSFPSLPFQQHESANPTKKRAQSITKRDANSPTQGHFSVPISSAPDPLQDPRHTRRWDEAGGGSDGGGGAPVAAAVRAVCAPADRPPVVPGGRRRGGAAEDTAAAGDPGGGGVHAAGRVHGAHALRVGHLHARLLPHAMGRRARLRLPIRGVRHQHLRDRKGHPPLARSRLLAQGDLPMAYIFQASIHADVKANTK